MNKICETCENNTTDEIIQNNKKMIFCDYIEDYLYPHKKGNCFAWKERKR
jgi:hypothetical protein